MLQETQMLSDEMTLADQCIQSEGLVQIKMMVANGKINIMDVLKPEEDLVTEAETKRPGKRHLPSSTDDSSQSPKKIKREKGSIKVEKTSSAETVTRWVVSTEFRKEQERLKFPTDPLSWDRLHVAHWLNWVQTEFPDTILHSSGWDIDGRELCALSHDEFKKKVMQDPGDTLWTHLELLRKCKFVAVLQHRDGSSVTADSMGASGDFHLAAGSSSVTKKGGHERMTMKKPPVRLGAPKFSVMSESSPGNRTGNNGQVQLWQFLLELLTEKDHCEVIHWCGDDGEFKLREPEIVAQLWGTRKNKPNMNYEKLSRALRYYYDGDMICKVGGKRFTYKFVCNLKDLIGYGPGELRTLVQEAQMKARGSISVYKD